MVSVFFQVLLGSELIKSSSEERSLLKNLGSWLGKITIGKNQVLRAREIDPKSLIIEVLCLLMNVVLSVVQVVELVHLLISWIFIYSLSYAGICKRFDDCSYSFHFEGWFYLSFCNPFPLFLMTTLIF